MCDSKFQGQELSAVIEKFLPALNAKRKLPAHTLRTLDALEKCRTEYMGGHTEACQECGGMLPPVHNGVTSVILMT